MTIEKTLRETTERHHKKLQDAFDVLQQLGHDELPAVKIIAFHEIAVLHSKVERLCDLLTELVRKI